MIIAAFAASPIFGQRGGGAELGDRPSRECRQEVMQLCAPDGQRDRSKIRSCLAERSSELSDKCAGEAQSRVGRRRGGNADDQPANYASAKVTRTLFFGSHPNQQIDVYAPKDAVDDLPVILFVHGGGWSMGDNKYVQGKPAYYTGKDYIFASAGYRLLPSSPVEEQARDVGAAVQAIAGQASSIGIDPEKIVLMGHSAGAHLAALVASDPQYAGDAFGAIKGAVLLDGAGYDIAANMAAATPRSRDLYLRVFGNDPARHAALSPLTHVGGRDAPNWLSLYVEERDASRAQSQLLANALTQAGIRANALPIAGTDHSRMNREIGTEAGAAQTEAIDAFLAQIVG